MKIVMVKLITIIRFYCSNKSIANAHKSNYSSLMVGTQYVIALQLYFHRDDQKIIDYKVFCLLN